MFCDRFDGAKIIFESFFTFSCFKNVLINQKNQFASHPKLSSADHLTL